MNAIGLQIFDLNYIGGHNLPSGPMAIDSGPTILLFKICWVDLSLLFSVSAPVSLGAGGILRIGSIILLAMRSCRASFKWSTHSFLFQQELDLSRIGNSQNWNFERVKCNSFTKPESDRAYRWSIGDDYSNNDHKKKWYQLYGSLTQRARWTDGESVITK